MYVPNNYQFKSIFALTGCFLQIVSYIKNRKTLVSLRLVDKDISRSAARGLFRRVVFRLGHSQSSTGLEALSSSDYALLVRYIDFKPRPFFRAREEYEYSLIEGDIVERIPPLLSKFVNLNTANIWPCQWDSEPFEAWFPRVLESIAKPQLRRLTRLHLPIDGSSYLTHCLNSDHHAKVKQLIRQIEHLRLHSRFNDNPHLQDLDTLLETATNLSSLNIGGFCEVFNLPVGDIDCNQLLRLKSLELNFVFISSYELLGVLERCKDTIRFVKVDSVSLTKGSWLHVLMQIKNNLKLLDFYLFDWEISLNKELKNRGDIWLDYGFFRRDYKLICLALGELQRQINANRLAEGLNRWPKKKFRSLGFLPLQFVMEKGRYTELISQSWDAEKDDGYHSDSE